MKDGSVEQLCQSSSSLVLTQLPLYLFAGHFVESFVLLKHEEIT